MSSRSRNIRRRRCHHRWSRNRDVFYKTTDKGVSVLALLVRQHARSEEGQNDGDTDNQRDEYAQPQASPDRMGLSC